MFPPVPERTPVFRLIRFFLVTSTLAAAVITLAIWVYRQNEVHQLVEITESGNITLARSLANAIWPRYSSFMTATSAPKRPNISDRTEVQEIADTVRAISAGLPILKVKLYGIDGVTIFSSVATEIGEAKTDNVDLLATARGGKSASQLIFRDEIASFGGAVQNRDVVESYLPLRDGTGSIQGVFELYSDVTPLMNRIRGATINIAFGFIVVFGALYGILFLVVRKADQTIAQQYLTITEKNVALQREITVREDAQTALKRVHDELEERVKQRTQELTNEITERRRAEEEVGRRRNELAHVVRVSVMGELASSIAHELNNPLTVISGSAQMCVAAIQNGSVNEDKFLATIGQIAEQASRASKIIAQVRGLIHKSEPERSLVDLNGLIRGVADMLQSDASEHGITVRMDLASSLPAVMADSIQIQQVILNLAHNGIEAMGEAGSRQGALTVRTSQAGSGVKVVVEDKGSGISSDNLPSIFQPFFTTKSDGLGMGLAICRTIVETHGGRLTARSTEGKGTSFCFTMPAATSGRS